MLYSDVDTVHSAELSGPDLGFYDHILLAFSGGKDSLACLLHLLKIGVDPSKIELHHHDVDGDGNVLMDWPVTKSYCKKIAEYYSLPIYFSYKIGGFEREMLRNESPTAPTRFEAIKEDGSVELLEIGGQGRPGTRLKFPQISPDLTVRWCSAYLKIDVMDMLIRNQERFLNKKILVVTGERAQESASRARYKTFEPHRIDSRDGKRKVRHVDHWRPIHAWNETDVWSIIAEFGIVPHVAYQLGWSRLSCMTCIFGSPNQWATILAVFPDRFEAIERYEKEFGLTIRRKETVRETAHKGKPYQAAVNNPYLVHLANAVDWSGPVHVAPDQWVMPAGAFGENAGPN